MSLTDKAADSKPSTPRKPYTSPRLMSYGHVKDIIQGGGGKKSDAAGTPPGGNSKSCWIAEQLYGVDDPRTWLLRAWLARLGGLFGKERREAAAGDSWPCTTGTDSRRRRLLLAGTCLAHRSVSCSTRLSNARLTRRRSS